MKIIIDNRVAKFFASNPDEIFKNPFLSNVDNQVSFRWPSLLEYLGMGSILSSLPPFDKDQPLFKACVSALCATEETEVLFHLYDRLFAENLKQISALAQMNSSFLLQAIKEQERHPSFFAALAMYEKSLQESASDTIHDLILYLAWDRLCVWMARLFDHQSTNPNFIKGIGMLRECLLESYQHIMQQGRTTPGIYRMLESFVFYQMREENLGELDSAEWTILSESFQVLKSQDELVDCFYIDDAVIAEAEQKMEDECYLTLDSPIQVNARLGLAQYMMDKLTSEVHNWGYVLSKKRVYYG